MRIPSNLTAILLFIFFLFPFNASAEIERIAIPCETGLCLYWWPKLPLVKGWHHDPGSSLNFSFNAQAPDGKTFANANAVIYAKASYKEKLPKTKSLEAFVNEDIETFRSADPSSRIQEVESLKTGDGQVLRSFTFFPKKTGNWERVAYGEEGEFYLVFTLSSRTKKGYDNALAAYEKFISGYVKGTEEE